MKFYSRKVESTKKWQTSAIIQEISNSNLETGRYGPKSEVSQIIRELTALQSFQRHIVLLEIVVLANSKKNRNIKANDVKLISIARSTDFRFKTKYVGMFLRFRSIVPCFQCFVRGPTPFGK